MTATSGRQPQAIACQLTAQCIPMWSALKDAGYTGSYWSPLGPIPALYTSMAGTVTIAAYNNAPNAGLTAMQNAMDAVRAGHAADFYANVQAYFATAVCSLLRFEPGRQNDRRSHRRTSASAVHDHVGYSRPGRANRLSGLIGGRRSKLQRAAAVQRWIRPAGIPVLLQLQVIQGHTAGRKGELA